MGETVYKLRKNKVDWRVVEGEVIALDLERAEYLAINPSGAQLWTLLAEGASREELVRKLEETFGIDEARASADLDAFVESLQTRQLIDAED